MNYWHFVIRTFQNVYKQQLQAAELKRWQKTCYEKSYCKLTKIRALLLQTDTWSPIAHYTKKITRHCKCDVTCAFKVQPAISCGSRIFTVISTLIWGLHFYNISTRWQCVPSKTFHSPQENAEDRPVFFFSRPQNSANNTTLIFRRFKYLLVRSQYYTVWVCLTTLVRTTASFYSRPTENKMVLSAFCSDTLYRLCHLNSQINPDQTHYLPSDYNVSFSM